MEPDRAQRIFKHSKEKRALIYNHFYGGMKSLLEGMKSPMLAGLFHRASSENKEYHTYSPDGLTSWCKSKSDRAKGTKTYKAGAGVPVSTIKEVKPNFPRLSSEELLG